MSNLSKRLEEIEARAEMVASGGGALLAYNITYSDIPLLLRAVRIQQAALEYVKHRTEQDPVKGMHPHGFIRSTRMRGVVVEALAQLEALVAGEEK